MSAEEKVTVELSVSALGMLRSLLFALNDQMVVASFDYYGEACVDDELTAEAVSALSELPEEP